MQSEGFHWHLEMSRRAQRGRQVKIRLPVSKVNVSNCVSDKGSRLAWVKWERTRGNS